MLQCDSCYLWVHAACDGMDEAEYESYANGLPGYEHRLANANVDALGHIEQVVVDTLVGQLQLDCNMNEAGYLGMVYTRPDIVARAANMWC